MSTQSNDGYGNGEFIRHNEPPLFNQLPAGFTWVSLYEKFKPFMDGNRVRRVQINELHERYSFDVDFIKARCFEEIEPNLPTVAEVGCYIALEERALPHPWLVSLGRKLKVLSTQL